MAGSFEFAVKAFMDSRVTSWLAGLMEVSNSMGNPKPMDNL